MALTKMTSIRRAARGAGLIAGLATLACEDSSGPVTAAGSYGATSFVTTPAGGSPRNEIAAGSTVDMVLHTNGTTTGHLHVASFAGTPAFDRDLTGTWTINGSTVTFDHGADTFIRDMDFTFSGDTIVGDHTFAGSGGVRIQITLTRD